MRRRGATSAKRPLQIMVRTVNHYAKHTPTSKQWQNNKNTNTNQRNTTSKQHKDKNLITSRWIVPSTIMHDTYHANIGKKTQTHTAVQTQGAKAQGRYNTITESIK